MVKEFLFRDGGIILVLLIVGVFGLLVMMGVLVANENSFDERHTIVETCLASDRYTREECIILAGGGQ